ncbi:MAG: hypothetical protein M3N16_00445 [Actinomycetota bacterium]|nr:hypothetical protein [Actinomycetota bacterium]
MSEGDNSLANLETLCDTCRRAAHGGR